MKHIFTKMMVIAAMLFAGSALMTACTPDQGDDYKGPPVLEIGEPNVINALKVEIPITAKKLTSIGYKVVAEGENAPASAMMVSVAVVRLMATHRRLLSLATMALISTRPLPFTS